MIELLGFFLICLSCLMVSYLIADFLIMQLEIFPTASEAPTTIWLTVLIWIIILFILF